MHTRYRWPLAVIVLLAALFAALPASAGVVSPAADTTPPTPPGNLTASHVRTTSVALAWTAATDNVGVTAYDVYQQGQLVKSVGGSTVSTTVTGLNANTSYGFYVNARDAAHNVSQASNTVTVTTPKSDDTTPPGKPGTPKVGKVTANTVALTWTAATDNVGVTGYFVYSTGKQVGQVTTNSATIDGLAPKTTYTFTVKAYDAAGNLSAASKAASTTTAASGGGSGAPGEVTQVTTDTDVPWGLVFLPDGSALFNERDTHDLVHLTAGGQKTVVATIPGVSGTDGEGGLLGLEISPTYSSDHWLYFYFTTATDNRIARFTYQNGKLDLASEQVLLKGIQRNKYHNGGRLRFGPDGKLYVGVGDAQNTANPQNLSSLNGKILRLNPDGSVPKDNPFPNSYVWSYGHRNVEGLAFDSQGRLWEAELGNSQMDELNLIVKGGDYGWPDCEGTAGSCDNPKYIKPVRTWPVADASPSGLCIVHDVLYMAALRGERLWVMKITGNSTSTPTAYFEGEYGRLRTVEASPDGGLWLTTSSGDKDSTPNNSNDVILHVALH